MEVIELDGNRQYSLRPYTITELFLSFHGCYVFLRMFFWDKPKIYSQVQICSRSIGTFFKSLKPGIGTDTQCKRTRDPIVTERFLSDHPYFVGVQYHPEFTSRPIKPSPPYLGLLLASAGKLQSYLQKGCRLSPR